MELQSMLISQQMYLLLKVMKKSLRLALAQVVHTLIIKQNNLYSKSMGCFYLGKSYISLTNNFSVDIILLDNEVVL